MRSACISTKKNVLVLLTWETIVSNVAAREKPKTDLGKKSGSGIVSAYR